MKKLLFVVIILALSTVANAQTIQFWPGTPTDYRSENMTVAEINHDTFIAAASAVAAGKWTSENCATTGAGTATCQLAEKVYSLDTGYLQLMWVACVGQNLGVIPTFTFSAASTAISNEWDRAAQIKFPSTGE